MGMTLFQPDLIERMMTAANEAAAKRSASMAEMLEPYREAIQKCLASGISVQQIQKMMQEAGVAEGRSVGAWQKYIRQGGYIQSRGKFKGLTREEIVKKAAPKSGESSRVPAASIVDQKKAGALAALAARRTPPDPSAQREPELTAFVAGDDL
jgi:hypothetical protein